MPAGFGWLLLARHRIPHRFIERAKSLSPYLGGSSQPLLNNLVSLLEEEWAWDQGNSRPGRPNCKQRAYALPSRPSRKTDVIFCPRRFSSFIQSRFVEYLRQVSGLWACFLRQNLHRVGSTQINSIQQIPIKSPMCQARCQKGCKWVRRNMQSKVVKSKDSGATVLDFKSDLCCHLLAL